MGLQIDETALRAKAVELGVIKDGEELPRNQRARVAAVLVADSRPRTPALRQPVCAKDITVRGNEITVDGEPFPWLVAAEPMQIGLNPGGTSTVRLTLLAENVQILKPEPDQSESE
jgi:hypothetical protein